MLICGVFYVIFGILGVQLYKGTMYYCDGTDISNVSTKEDCLANNNSEWVNAKYNYDDLGEVSNFVALLTLFVMSTIDGWVGLMHQTIDAVDVDIEPIRNYNQWSILFCVVFLIIINFLILNMFVCVLVENYQKTYKEMKEEKKLKKQLAGQEKTRAIRSKIDYKETAGKHRSWLLWLVKHHRWNKIVLILVFVHATALATIYYKMSGLHLTILDCCTYLFAVLYILEATVNITAYSPAGFVQSGWRINDILLIISLLFAIIIHLFVDTTSTAGYQFMIAIRVLQATFLFVKLLRTATGLRSLVDTVIRTLPQVGNLTLLFLLIFFIWAALGVELFGLSGCDKNHSCDGLGEYATFANVGMAFMTLFRIATGDNWNGILKDALRENCDDSTDCTEFCCVSSILATLYFVTFVLGAQFILLNIVVAMLLKGFEESTEADKEEREDEEERNREELSRFELKVRNEEETGEEDDEKGLGAKSCEKVIETTEF